MYDEYGDYYPTYGGAESPGGSSWDIEPSVRDPRSDISGTNARGAAQAADQNPSALIPGPRADAPRTSSSSGTTGRTTTSTGGGSTVARNDALSSYEQLSLQLSQQKLEQDDRQFYANLMQSAQTAQGNLGFNYAQLGQQGSQFQQNYGLDVAQFQGSPFQWAGLEANTDLDQQRVDLSRQLGLGDDARGWAQLALAEEDHDLRMYLGQGQLAQSQAEIQATMARLGIDLYQSNLNAEIARARLALDSQVEAARAGALSAQAAADAARAQAALRAVEVELQLGQGNLELGWQKTRDAMALGLEDITVRREELGLKDKIATQDLALQTLLGVEGINVSREKIANDRFLGISDQQTRRDIAALNAQVEQQRIMSTLTGPRDWARAVEMRRMMTGGPTGAGNPFAALAPGAGQLAGDVGGPSEAITLDSFLADNGFTNFQNFNFQNGPWQQMVGAAGGFNAPTANPWQGMNIPSQPGTMDWQSIWSQISGQSGGTTAAGSNFTPPPQLNPQLEAEKAAMKAANPTPYTPPPGAGAASYAALGTTYTNPSTGEQIPFSNDPHQGYRPGSNQGKATVSGHWENEGTLHERWIPDPDTYDAQGRRIRIYVRPDGTRVATPVIQSGGSMIITTDNGTTMEVPDQRRYDENGFLQEGGAVQGLSQGKQYRKPDGSTYVVPGWAGPQDPGDTLVPSGPAYSIRLPDGSVVKESDYRPTQDAMRQGIVPQQTYNWRTGKMEAQPTPTVPVPAPAPQPGTLVANSAGSFSMAPASGGFTAPGLDSFFPGYSAQTGGNPANVSASNPFGWTDTWNGIPIPSTPQLQLPSTSGMGGNNVVQQMYQQYLQQFPTSASQQSPSGRNALAGVQAAMAAAQQSVPTTAPYTPPTAPAPGQTPTNPYTPYGQQYPGGIQPGNTTGNPNWLPAVTGSTGGYATPVGSYQPDSPGVYATGGTTLQTNAAIMPSEAGGAPGVQYLTTASRPQGTGPATRPTIGTAPAGGTYSTPEALGSNIGTDFLQSFRPPAPGAPVPVAAPTGGYTPIGYEAQAYDPSSYDPSWTGQHAGYAADTTSGSWGSWPSGTGVPSYATGTSYVPKTGPALLHEGEAVIPAAQNPANPTSTPTPTTGTAGGQTVALKYDAMGLPVMSGPPPVRSTPTSGYTAPVAAPTSTTAGRNALGQRVDAQGLVYSAEQIAYMRQMGQPVPGDIPGAPPEPTYPSYDPRSPYYAAYLAATTTTPTSTVYSTYRPTYQSTTPLPGSTPQLMTPVQRAKLDADILANEQRTAAAYNAGLSGGATPMPIPTTPSVSYTLPGAPTLPGMPAPAPAPEGEAPKGTAVPSTMAGWRASGLSPEDFAHLNRMVATVNDPATLGNTIPTYTPEQLAAMAPLGASGPPPGASGASQPWLSQGNPAVVPGLSVAGAQALAQTMSADAYQVQQMGYTPITLTRAQQQMLGTTPVFNFGTPEQVHGLTVGTLPGYAWDSNVNQWVPTAQLSRRQTPAYAQGPAQVQQAAPSPTNLNGMVNPQAPLQPNQQQMGANQQPTTPGAPQPVANAPQHAQPTSPPGTTTQTAGFQAPTVTTPPPAAAATPPPGSVAALMQKLPSPSQVSFRVWSQELSPAEKEMAIGAWEAQGWDVPSILALIERNRLTRQQGAYGSTGYAGVGR